MEAVDNREISRKRSDRLNRSKHNKLHFVSIAILPAQTASQTTYYHRRGQVTCNYRHVHRRLVQAVWASSIATDIKVRFLRL